VDLQLKGKRALVTGSSAGIGAGIARRLAGEGARVVVHGRNAARTEAVLAAVRAVGGEAASAVGDLSSDEGAEKVFESSRRAFGGIDILVNNAGGYASRPWLDTTPQNWRAFYEDDVLSAVRLILAAAPAMRQAGWGRIINIATGMATTPQAVMADYAAAKAALVNSTVSLAKELAGTGVTVNTISPGLIATDGVERVLREVAAAHGWGEDWSDIQRRWLKDVLHNEFVSRLGTVDEVADLVAFVASPRAEYINGANLRIDGGLAPSIN
jgi:NAD(P)-dependent dehydrogenase (short-subunit alcohol dehydrogenase family)